MTGFLDHLRPYRKALVAYVGSLLLALALVAPDGLTLPEVLSAVGGSLVPAGGTYAARNATLGGPRNI